MSDSGSPPTPPRRTLLSLPPELLSHILSLALVLPEDAVSQARTGPESARPLALESVRTRRRVIRVCRTFYDLAQPWLSHQRIVLSPESFPFSSSSHPQPSAPYPVLSVIYEPLPHLRFPSLDPLFAGLPHLPQLQHLHLPRTTRIDLSLLLPTLSAHTSHLRTLSLGAIRETDDLWALLAALPSLRTLELASLGHAPSWAVIRRPATVLSAMSDWVPDDEPVHSHAALESLAIDRLFDGSEGSLLRAHLPNLVHLQLSTHTASFSLALNRIVGLGSLRSLALRSEAQRPDELVDALLRLEAFLDALAGAGSLGALEEVRIVGSTPVLRTGGLGGLVHEHTPRAEEEADRVWREVEGDGRLEGLESRLAWLVRKLGAAGVEVRNGEGREFGMRAFCAGR